MNFTVLTKETIIDKYEIVSEFDGEVDEIFFKHGDLVSKGDVIVRLK